MDFAKLDRRISILQKTVSQNDIGEEVAGYSVLHHCWAARQSRPGREFIDAGRIVSDDRVYFHIRHLNAIDTTCKVQDGSEQFDILDVQYSAKRGESITLGCKRVT